MRGCGEGGVEFKAMETKVHTDPEVSHPCDHAEGAQCANCGTPLRNAPNLSLSPSGKTGVRLDFSETTL
jgi:hypothetical protein